MTNEPDWPTITKVELGTLMGHPVVHLHFVGDSDNFPDEVKNSATELANEIWPDEKDESWKGAPIGANVCVDSPAESAPSIAVKIEDAVKYGLTVFNGELHLDY